MLRNIHLILQYDGTNYHGWQIQPNAVAIQEVIEATLSRVTNSPVRVTGAGRTDSGVHAWGQVANFRSRTQIPLENLKQALNSLLPPDIKVLKVSVMSPDFDSRRAARDKVYKYFLLNRREPSPWLFRYSWHHPRVLDLQAMVTAAGDFIGEHDFTAFRASDCQVKNPVRLVENFSIRKTNEIIIFEVRATGFLKHMVRGMVGTLVEVGRGRFRPGGIKEMLESRDRTQAGPNAPARGLFLWKVNY